MNKKQLSCALSALLLLAGCSNNNSSKTSEANASSAVSSSASTSTSSSSSKIRIVAVQLVPEANSIVVNEEVIIEAKADSDLTWADSDFTASGGTIVAVSNGAKFTADKAGTYTITVDKEGVKSNVVTIIAVEDSSTLDSAASEASIQTSMAAQASQEAEATLDDDKNTTSSSTGTSSSSATNQTSGNTNTNANNNTSTSSSNSTANSTTSASAGQRLVNVQNLASNPEAYLDQYITLSGSIANENGKTVIYPQGSTSQGITLEGVEASVIGKNAYLTGHLVKDANGQYVFDVNNTIEPLTSAVFGKAGALVSSVPKMGTFVFTANNVVIRSGNDGLASPESGLAYYPGLEVYYDGTYQKDGYTWIKYTSYSGIERSVPIGDDKYVLYGYVDEN
ncbi:MAG: SH3 domain-containing protein [Allobaculum sp.]|nr:SH3 domain-containing protein [Allobaculum sp.]